MTIQPGLEPPWWLEEALVQEGGREESAPLDGDIELDVAIIGGGYAGMWSALALRARAPDLRVGVLEADFCGAGPSGRNGGFVHGYWEGLHQLRDLIGERQALELCRISDRIVPGVRTFCDARGEDVWLREGGLLKVATTPAQEISLDRDVEAARAAGVPERAVPLGRDELSERCRSPVFRRGVFFPQGGTVHPGRLARALRRALIAEQIELYERTRVRHLRAGSPNVLVTGTGSVRAREAVVTVNAAAADWRPIAGRLTVFGSYVVLTEPAPQALERIGWTGGEAITDGRMFLHYFRTTPDGRVLMGSGSGPIGYGNRLDGRFTHDLATAERAERGLRRLLPGLSDVRVEHAWGGPIDVSADHFPFFGTVPDTRIHYAAGFSGNGVGPAWLAGQTLASLALGVHDEWAAMPLVNRSVARVPPEPFRHIGGRGIRAAVIACEEADEEGRPAPLPARMTAAVPKVLGMRLGQR